jgi:hypothetical protein
MAGLAHLGVGLAAKGAAPRTPLWALVAASYWIDIVFGVFYLLGLERPPRSSSGIVESTGDGRLPDVGAGCEVSGPVHGGAVAATTDTDPPAPWSHGLLMATVWSTLAGLLAWAVSRRRRTGLLIGSVAFSHLIVDVVTQPMTAVFPRQGRIPVAFESRPRLGLGLYRWKTAVNICEYGSVVVGAAVYVRTFVKARRGSRPASSDAGRDVTTTVAER